MTMILAFGHVCQNKETAELVRSSPRSPIEERFDVRAVTFGVDSASLINETFAQPTDLSGNGDAERGLLLLKCRKT